MKRSQLYALLFAFAVNLSAQTARVADVTEQNLRRHIEYLASDKLEGRRTGEQGATFAAGYIANAFAQYKLRPGFRTLKSKSNYLQPFPYVAGVTLGKDNFLRIVPADSKGENKMETGINWMPLGYSPNADIPPSPIVFAGYGISSSELKYDDYAGLDVKDKVVLIFDSTPDASNPHSEFGRYNIHVKASIAKDKGARGIILIAGEPEFKKDRLSVLSYDRTKGETALPVVGIVRQHGAELLGAGNDQALGDLETTLGTRANKATGPLDQPAAVAKAVAQIKVVLTKKNADAYNVIGILEGSDPVLKSEAIVIGAHYDHLGRGGQDSLAANSAEIHHGADDNASGTSAVLELARQFAKEKNNKRTMIFMAFAGEEEGLLGSKFYVENPVWPLDKTVAMINLDMVGRLNANKLTVGGIGTATELKQLVESRNTVGMH
ncbi:MAG: M28 family peptidase, partial [Pyrinomonadaceae bacterium]